MSYYDLAKTMEPHVRLASNEETLPLRARYRLEMNCQVTKDSIHQRPGWTLSYLIESGGVSAGFGSLAIAGPWKGKPTLFEFYLLPEFRTRAFELFDAFRAAARPAFIEIQSNDTILFALACTYARNLATEAIVFHDHMRTDLPAKGALLRCVTPHDEIASAIEERSGGPEYVLELSGNVIAKGGFLFHYNRPYCDIYMGVNEHDRRKGFGSYLIQELKREAYALGAIPAARCNPDNVASRRTLQRAGFVPFAHIVNGSFDTPDNL
jgi:hypothetical protein